MKIVDKMGAPNQATEAVAKMPEPFCKTLEETQNLVEGVADDFGIPALEDFGYEPMGDDEGFRLEVERLRDCAVFARNYRARVGTV